MKSESLPKLSASQELVRQHYAQVAQDAADGDAAVGDAAVGAADLGAAPAGECGTAPAGACSADRGCGRPLDWANLKVGEYVLDLGCGAGSELLLAAQAVGPAGRVYGLDMTPQMLALAQQRVEAAALDNVVLLSGLIEDLPLPDASVDVVISNCVINLSGDKPQVMRELFRVLVPGGRIGLSDVVAEDHVTPAERLRLGQDVGCVAGALSRSEYLEALAAAGFQDASVRFTHEVAPGLHGAIVQAVKPAA